MAKVILPLGAPKTSQHNAYLIPIKDFPVVDPPAYFKTTGDAITKLEQMRKDTQLLLNKINAVTKLLIKSRGEDKWMETSYTEDGELFCMPKSPRPKTATDLADPNRRRTSYTD